MLEIVPGGAFPMSFLSKLFGGGSKYDDAQLVSVAMKALSADPLLKDPTSLVVTSDKGAVTLGGIIARRQDKERIEGVVRNAYTEAGLKLERVINNLKLSSN
jgi:hypothetical protein